MQVKVKIAVGHLVGALVLPALLIAGSAGARDTRPGAAHAGDARQVGFLDGGRWVAARRQTQAWRGLQAWELEVGGHKYRAFLGRTAIVELTPGLAPAARASLLRRLGVRPRATLSEGLGLLLVEGSPDEDGIALALRLARHPEVLSSIPDLHFERRRRAISIPPDDPRYGGQWYLARLQIERAWRVSTGTRDTTVVIIDDGCDLSHPDLARAFVGGRDVLDGDDDPSFQPDVANNAHGTACAGIVGAVADNGVGIAGVCPECSLACVRLLPESGHLTPISADIQAFEYALEIDASVVSNSWGYVEPVLVPSLLRRAIERVAREARGGRGALVVFAAGNENREIFDGEIATLPSVLAVGAVNQFDEAAPFGNFGEALALSAPTGSLTTDIAGPDGDSAGDYTNLFGGTSAACPIVAGIAGLLISAKPELPASEIAAVLRSSARRAPFALPDARGHDPMYGYGIVNPVAALEAIGLTPPEAAPAQADAAAPDASEAGEGENGDDAPSAGADDPRASGPADGCGCRLAARRASAESRAWMAVALLGALCLRRRSARRLRRT